MELLGILGVVIGALLLAVLATDVLAWPIGGLFLWTQKKLGFPRNVKTGAEGLIGQTVTVAQPFAWNNRKKRMLGKVRLNGEMWWACMPEEQAHQIQQGACVQVEGVDGLVLVVRTVERKL
jgi:membrane protein implicated in regulation of membrane protease activity